MPGKLCSSDQSTLVEAYEEKNYAIPASDPVEAISYCRSETQSPRAPERKQFLQGIKRIKADKIFLGYTREVRKTVRVEGQVLKSNIAL